MKPISPNKSRQISKLRLSQEGYDTYAQFYEKDHGYLDSFEDGLIPKLLKDVKGKKILDIGCGAGRVITQIKKKLDTTGTQFTAADISDEMLKITQKKFKDIETVNADINKLPFKNDSFDIVIAAFVIVHVRDLTVAFDEVYRVLKPGGVFILTNINQRHAPKLKLSQVEKIVIKSFYHIPRHVLEALDRSFFKIEKEEIVQGEDVWINQIVKAVKD